MSSERDAARLAAGAARDTYARTRRGVVEARKRWRRARRAVSLGYRRARPKARARWKAWKASERARVRLQVETWKAELRERWAARRLHIAQAGATAVARAKLRSEHAKLRARELALHRRQVEHRWKAHAHRGKQGESDDTVRADLERHHPELVPIFNRHRERFKKSAKMSRTEAVLHWAHDNPGEVMALTSHQAEIDVRRAIREHEQTEREANRERAKLGKATRRSRREAASAVPF